MARVLGRVRLSVETDETTSPERQRGHIQAWADANDHQIVGWAEDLDVSGSVNPFEAPMLGPWLARLDEWDILVAWKLSRLARKAIPLSALCGYCLDNQKTIVCTHDNIDLSTWVGRLIASVLAHVAEGELEEIRARVIDTQKYLRANGRFRGGAVPYGYESYAKGLKLGHGLRIYEPEAEVVRGVVNRVFEGHSLNTIAKSLNKDGVSTKLRGRWNQSTLSNILRSRSLIGQSTHNKRLVVDENGVPIERAEPLISPARFAELQTRLDDARKGPGGPRTGETRLLLDIAYCGTCGAKMYHHEQKKPSGLVYRYWRCIGMTRDKTCTEPITPAGRIEDLAIGIAISECGDLPMTEQVWVAAEGPEPAELARTEDAISNLRKERDAGFYDGDDNGYMARLGALVERRKSAAAAESRPARYERRGTGQTWAQALSAADTIPEKRDVLLKLRMRLDVSNRGFDTRVTTCLDDIA